MSNPVRYADLILIAPHIALFLFSLIPLILKLMNRNTEPKRLVTILIALSGLAFAGITTLVLSGKVQLLFDGALVRDGISVWTNFTLIFAAAVALFITVESSNVTRTHFSEFVFLLLNGLIGMMFLSMANDLMIAFIAIEMMSLALYLLIMLGREEKLSKEAAFKYFVLGSFASAVLLYGISFIYGTAGSTYFNDIIDMAPQLAPSNLLFWMGVVMVVLGLAFKVSIFPFHSWTPDVYDGAPSTVTAFMATAVKMVTFVIFLRVAISGGMGVSKGFFDTMQWLAVLTMLVGNIGAIMQARLKRMLAYSSVAHSGYALVGLLAAVVAEDPQVGSTSLLFYLFTYVLMTLGAFSCVSWMEKHADSSIHLSDLAGLGRRHPWVSLGLTLLLLSLAGLPPTLGFFGKFYLFTGALKQGLLWLALWGVLNSVISAYYYLRPVVQMYMVSGDESPEAMVRGRALTELAIGLMAFLIILIGLVSSPLYDRVSNAVSGSF